MIGPKPFDFTYRTDIILCSFLVWCCNCIMLPSFPWNTLNPNTSFFCRLNYVLRLTNKILKLFFRHTRIFLTRCFCISSYCHRSNPYPELEVTFVLLMRIVDWWKSCSGSSFSWNRFPVTEDKCKCFTRQVGQNKRSEHKCRSPLMCYTILFYITGLSVFWKVAHFMLFCSCVFSVL